MTNDENSAPGAGGHEIPMTPPPLPRTDAAPSVPASADDGARPRRGGATAITVVTAVVGGFALAGVGGTTALAAVGDATSRDDVQTVDTAGVESLDLEVDASGVVVEFDDVDEARLEVSGGRGGSWTLDRDGDELVVHSPRRLFGWWGFDGWLGRDESVTLTLPESLSGSLDAEAAVGAGSLDIDGDFAALELRVDAGALFVGGSARSLDVNVNAGRADLQVADVAETELDVSAGRLTADLTGTAPDEVSVDVSAGSLELTLPDAEYDVRQDVSAGSLDNRLDMSSASHRTVQVSLSAGSATLRAGD